ncbi:cell wall synthase accessory phosphoprotein MacP [Streptococcus gallolyticus]|uniref:cell wall synthase accessory phosphoprotein MacP n=1 Tax=Streptococcus hepaticus TaxID=3349163 RepID=UPI001C95BCEF|nr:cell wall synthase accessory phosphoprotein MacP [Streptococcus gallolyticus]MBY5041693.1 cell wall synthase accessory phosphoprotein MacP [Streptococcus gallolyticus]
MRKPLLSDEVLEREARKKRFGYFEEDYDDEELEDWEDEDYQGYQEGQTIRIPVEASIVKSRRIETIKKERFKSKVNKTLFWIVFLLILFVLAVIYF